MIFQARGRASRLLAATAVGALGAVALAVPASASPGDIDPDARGSVTLHKFETPAGGAAGENNSGLLGEVDTSGWVPLPGVTFQIQKVNEHGGSAIDLATFEGWSAIENLTAGDLDGTTNYGFTASEVTDEAGVANFPDLDLGLYLVTETGKPAHVTSTVAPFLLTLPTPTGNTWNYDVHAYPKNSVGGLNKTVEAESQKAVGDEIVWTITGTVPVLSANETHSKFVMTDNLPNAVSYVDSVVYFDDDVADVGDYVITGGPDGKPVLTLTAPGLVSIASSTEVKWEINTLVNELPADGILKNNASLVVNDSEPFEDDAEQEWGGVEIVKVSEGEPVVTLEGAEFQLFKSSEDATAGANPITVDGEATFITGEDGVVSIAGVQTGTYYLLETKAPAGYTLNPTPIEVVITAGDATSLVEVEVENAQKGPFELPRLGASGMIASVIAGGVLITAGGALVLRNRRMTDA